ncbi:hypothetical protein CFP56_019119 [Quercus suber]|uniref:Uncharacterized protein n=1 Tax=Quercus suber TaxID=58331 RepID=A0AAW0M0V8_QUESU
MRNVINPHPITTNCQTHMIMLCKLQRHRPSARFEVHTGWWGGNFTNGALSLKKRPSMSTITMRGDQIKLESECAQQFAVGYFFMFSYPALALVATNVGSLAPNLRTHKAIVLPR